LEIPVTVLPFRRDDRERCATPPAGRAGTAVATGAFRGPTGSSGSFRGTYRLERLLEQFGQLAAAGVFTGELVDADGTHLGIGSRRVTAAVELSSEADSCRASVGPLDVNLIGLVVGVDELTVTVPSRLSGVRSQPVLPGGVVELMHQVVSASSAGCNRTSAQHAVRNPGR
jgi:hypothetical protein